MNCTERPEGKKIFDEALLLATNPNPLAFTSGVPTNNKNELDGLNLVLIFQHHNNLAPLNTIQHDCLTAQTSGIPRATTAAREEGQDRGCFGKTLCVCVCTFAY